MDGLPKDAMAGQAELDLAQVRTSFGKVFRLEDREHALLAVGVLSRDSKPTGVSLGYELAGHQASTGLFFPEVVRTWLPDELGDFGLAPAIMLDLHMTFAAVNWLARPSEQGDDSPAEADLEATKIIVDGTSTSAVRASRQGIVVVSAALNDRLVSLALPEVVMERRSVSLTSR